MENLHGKEGVSYQICSFYREGVWNFKGQNSHQIQGIWKIRTKQVLGELEHMISLLLYLSIVDT